MSTTGLIGGKPLAWPSMTAPMDLNSAPDRVSWGRWRYVLNVRGLESGRACRREGWRRFGHQTGHTNSDMRDQHGTRRPINSVYLHKSPTGSDSGNRFYAGTATDIWRNRVDGGWRNVARLEAGGDWSFTSLNDVVVAANGKTVLWQRSDDDSFRAVESLATIGLSSAAVVWTYEGVIFLADVVMDNTRVAHRVVWGDINSIGFEPGMDSIAGFKDLNPGERILASVPTGSTYTLITTHGAWRHGVVDGRFAFQQIYFSKERDACVIGSRAIAVNRETIFYLGADGMYTISPYSPAPAFLDWASLGMPPEFMQDTPCLISASGYDPTRNELYFSSVILGLTYVVNTRISSTSIIDHAFTAMTYAAMDRTRDVAMWWVESGICTAAEMDSQHPVGPLDDARKHPAVVGGANACSPFDPPCYPCSAEPEMVMASGADYTLKVIDSTYFARDVWVLNAVVPLGYELRFITGCNNWGTDANKRVSKVTSDFTAMLTDVPGKLRLVVHTSANPHEPSAATKPNSRTLRLVEKSIVSQTPPGSDAPNFQPLQWTFMADARFITFELRMDEQTGCQVCFSNFKADVSQSPNSDL